MEVTLLSNPESLYENLKTYSPTASTGGVHLAANSKFFAYLDAAGSGGSVGLLPLSSYGKNHIPISSPAYQQPVIRAHSQLVEDFAFHPFNTQLFFTCSTDKAALKVWDVPSEGLVIDLSSPKTTLGTSSKAPLYGVQPHSSADNILAVRGSRELAVLDLTASKETLLIGSDQFNGDIQSFSWSFAGDLLLTIGKDRQLRFFDGRTAALAGNAVAHEGLRYASLQCLGDSPYLLSLGHNKQWEREFFLWDHRQLSAGPVAVQAVDPLQPDQQANQQQGPLLSIFDMDRNHLLLGGRGDVYVKSYSFRNGEMSFQSSHNVAMDSQLRDKTWSLALLPKQSPSSPLGADECAHVLKLTEGQVQTIAIRDQEFERDSSTSFYESGPALSASTWLSGENSSPLRIPLSLPPPPPPPSAAAALPQPGDKSNDDKSNSDVGGSRSVSPLPFDESRSSKRLSIGSTIFKYRHMYGTENKKELTAFNLTPDLSSLDSPLIACSEQYWAVPYRSGGGGGPVYISRLDSYGRIAHDCVTLNRHKSAVQDLTFSPFQSNLLATGSIDSAIHLWDVDTLFQDGSLSREAVDRADPLASLSAQSSVRVLAFHPTVSQLLVSSGQDLALRFHDVTHGAEVSSIRLRPESEAIANFSFSYDGLLVAAATKGRTVQVLDARVTKSVQSVVDVSKMGRNLRVVWCGRSSNEDPLVTVSSGSGGNRQICLWDVRNPSAPVITRSIDNASGQLFPLYDEGLNVVFLAGKGDTILRAFEISSLGVEGDYMMDRCVDFQNGMEPIAGVAMLPKRCCDVRSVEVARLLKLTKDSVSTISFKVPRAEHLKPYFQDDIYRPVRSLLSQVSVDDWMNVEVPPSFFQPQFESIQPEDMIKASEKPAEPLRSEVNSKVQAYRASIRIAQEEEKQREDAFAKLQKLAVQNVQYHANLSGANKFGGELAKKTALQQEEDDDSDGGWDD
eukprot:gene2620-2863_t